MTARDLDALVTALRRLNCGQLKDLSTTTILDNFSFFGSSTKERIIEQVRAYLEGISPLSSRLHYVGVLYCWLAAPEDALSPWELYRVNPFKVTLIYFALHRRIARELGMQGYPQAFVPIAAPSRRYACVIVPDMAPTNEHCVICVCVWNSLSYVAVWAAELVGREHLRSALASALCGNPEDFRVGSFETLERAYLGAHLDELEQEASPASPGRLLHSRTPGGF
ncbi:hypothetical protein MTO96_034349 [Rhipicephalus appendiculatus]